MNELLTSGMQRHIQILGRYIGAMENGNIDALVAVLAEIEQDQTLGRMMLEINEVYQEEDYMLARPPHTEQVQQLLASIAEVKTTMDEMPVPSLAGSESRIDAFSQTTQDATSASIKVLSSAHLQSIKPISARRMPTQVLPSKKVASESRWYRARRTWLIAALLIAVTALVLFPNSGALASQIFSFFHVQQFQPIPVTQQDIQTLSSHPLPSLEDLGSLEVQTGSLQTHDHLTETQAAQMIGFPLLLPHYLPQGISNTPNFSVMDGGQATFTFSASKAHDFFAKNGYGNVNIPTRLDGATFEITTTAGAAIAYGDQEESEFMIVEIPSPVLSATGSATLQDLQSLVLSLPGLPPQLVTELRQIDLTSGVVPLPIPAGADSQAIEVHGTSGVLLTTHASTTIAGMEHFPIGSAAVWQDQGIIYAVGGIISDSNQLLKSANSLG